MADFLLELLTEEIPARMQPRAIEELRDRFVAACAARGLAAAHIDAHVTARRLALIAGGLAAATEPTREERRGPRADAPDGAVAGFARGAGVARETLTLRDDPKGRFFYALIQTPGRPASEVLAEACVEAVTALAWPKAMRWGEASVAMDAPRWVRPLAGVVALLDGDIVPMVLMGVASGRETFGHRFMSCGPIAIATPVTYAAQLQAAHVMLDAAERARTIAEGAQAAASAAGLVLVEDAGLVAENAGLTEWPVPLLGHFDPAFLAVPREAIQLTMRTNQKYFACVDDAGSLAPAFVCVANLAAADGGAAIVAGNARVLAARLADARFFWEQDRALGIEAMAARLGRVVFHEKLGSMADKAGRVARLARWLAESGAVPGADPDMAERAGLLAKADLTSAMVGEFPELQGVMGGYYARAAGKPEAVAAAVRDHYRPVGPSDFVPGEPVSVALALADKLDTLSAFYAIGQPPTGSTDPFALRRAALGFVALLIDNGIRLDVTDAITEALSGLVDVGNSQRALDAAWEIAGDIGSFIVSRIYHQQRGTGVRNDLVTAVYALGDADLVRLLARVRALQAFIASEDGANLLPGYKRAANILAIEAKRDGVARFDAVTADASPLTPADCALVEVLGPVADAASAAVAAEDFTGAMAALARLRAPIDAFFEGVMVNEPAMRATRLAMLQRFVDAVHGVADFSKVEG